MTKVCQNCKTVNVNDATFCEKCGKKLPEFSNASNTVKKDKIPKNKPSGWLNEQSPKSKTALILGVIGLIIIFLIVIAASNNSSTDTSTSATPATSSQPTNTTDQTHPEAKNIVILSSVSWRDDIGDYIINGTVKNKNDFGVSFVKINAIGYDNKGNVINSNYTYADEQDLPAGGKSTFVIYLEDPGNNIVKYDLQVVDADKSLYTAPTKSTTQSTSSSDDQDNGYISGEAWATKALDAGWNKYEYLPDFGGTYPDIVQDKSEEFKSNYEAGYIDYLKSVDEYP